MGGMGGGASEDDNPFGRGNMPGGFRAFSGGMPGGMGGVGGGPRKGETVKRQLLLSLEDLYNGCTKKIKVTRKRAGGSEEKILEIAVRPGWKKGTAITFENEGDEEPGVIPGDIQFIIGEKDHDSFKREGNDLIHETRLSLADALCGTKIDIRTLDGRTLTVPVTDVAQPGSSKVVKGEGMPVSKSPGQKGDLIIKFTVQFPTHIAETKKQQLKTLLSAK